MLNVIGFAVGVLGIVLTVYYERQARKSQAEVRRLSGLRKRVSWAELQSAALELADCVKRAGFEPTMIVTPGLNGATVANLLVESLPGHVPVYVGISEWKSEPGEVQRITPDGYIAIETSKWNVLIPHAHALDAGDRILIVDDLVMSGEFLQKCRDALISAGARPESVKSASVVTTGVCVKSRKAPDFYWLNTDEVHFYFPWGQAR